MVSDRDIIEVDDTLFISIEANGTRVYIEDSDEGDFILIPIDSLLALAQCLTKAHEKLKGEGK